MNAPAFRAASFGLLFAFACGRGKVEPAAEKAPAAQPDHSDEKEHEQLPRIVRLTEAVIRAAGVRTEPARKQRLEATVDLSGQIVSNPDGTAMIGARTSGRIVRCAVREGDRVRAGQTIALLSSPEVAKLRGEAAVAQARAEVTRKNAARLRELFRERLGSDQEALTAEAEATSAKATLDATRRTLRALGADALHGDDSSVVALISPIAGTVVQLDGIAGRVVDPSHTIATVADLSQVFFRAQVFEKDLERVRERAHAEVRLNGYPQRVFAGTVVRLSGEVDPQGRTITARIALDSAVEKLALGLFGTARVSVRTPDAAEVLAVPLSALTTITAREVLFVRQPDGDFQLHDVRLGRTAGGFAAVVSGLDPGEQVVVAGVHTLKSAVLKSTMEDE